jgi:Met-zincin/Domain of unknown function (DUF5117)
MRIRNRTFLILPHLLSATLLFAGSLFLQSSHAGAQPATPPKEAVATIEARTAGLKKMDGFFPLYWEPKAGKLLLEIPSFDKDFLYLDQLPYGIGSNDLGLDRGQLGSGVVVHFMRSGNKVLLLQPNLAFRSSSSDPDERAAVQQSFAESVLFGFKVEAEEADGQGGHVLVDASDFFLQDPHGVAERLMQAKQGAYKLDPTRSAILPESTRNFPRNTEVEALLTFTSDAPSGSYIADVTPNPHAVTVRERHSLIELPGPGYTPRAYNPNAGFFSAGYRDYSAPLGAPLDQLFIARHRLQKKDPSATMSDPIEPITYYVDRGAPEPIRTALVEGASWWNQAFEAAGYRNAFRVEVLPEGADPMDIRYNMIQWVHRYTRGWSYGEGVTDPRTGEIIKGQVTLGSLRGRQDFMIAQGLLDPYLDGAPLPTDNALRAMVLARLRQLAAHEVGHTLGLEHNFAASSLGQGTSVMDYPHPLITLDSNGKPDLSHAYAVGIGAWDKVAITYGYAEFPADKESADLAEVLLNAQKQGLYFVTDDDARPLGSAHPHAHLWDNGPDPAAELDRVLAVRAAALERFGLNAIPVGTPVSQLADVLVPLYLMHRYQTEAAAKEIGGLDYRYALRGDGQEVTAIVSPADQRKALAAVLRTLAPEMLTLPEPLLRLLPPVSPGYPRTRESFAAFTGLAFDPVAAAASAADLTLALLFDPQRASRLVEYHARDAGNPGLDEVLNSVLKATWQAPRASGLAAETQSAVESATLESLLGLAASNQASPEARAIARFTVTALKTQLSAASPLPRERQAHRAAALARIAEFERDPAKFVPAPPVEAPPGMPIGGDD